MSDDAGALRWQIDLARLYRLAACVYRGRFAELTNLTPLFLREAEDRGDEFLALGLRGWRSNVAWLALDAPDDAVAYDGAFVYPTDGSVVSVSSVTTSVTATSGTQASERWRSSARSSCTTSPLRSSSSTSDGRNAARTAANVGTASAASHRPPPQTSSATDRLAGVSGSTQRSSRARPASCTPCAMARVAKRSA